MEAKQNEKYPNPQDNVNILSSPSSGLRRIESSISASLIQSVEELSKLEEETRAFLESSTHFSPSQVNVVSLSEEKIVIEVQLKKSGEDIAQESECDQSNPDNKEFGSHSEEGVSGGSASETDKQPENQNNLMVNQNCSRSTRRAVSECVDVATPIRGILKMSRTARRTVSESHAGDDDSDEVFVSSPDVSIDGEEKTKKCVHFNERIYMNTFRSNSSITSRKNKTVKRTLRKLKKLSGSESSSDIESHEKYSSSTEDLKINDLPELQTTPTNNKQQGQVTERKVMVVKPLFQNGTIFTVTPVDDSELEGKRDEGMIEKSTRPGRQDSGYDSEESREANEENVDETSQITWQEVKSKSRRRKNRKPHTDQLRKESRVEAEGVDQQEMKENVSRAN